MLRDRRRRPNDTEYPFFVMSEAEKPARRSE